MLLLVVLVGAAAATRPGFSSTSDEGAGIVQADLLDNGSWSYARPAPEIDPTGELDPFPLGDAGDNGLSPYAKHPAYPLLLRPFAAAGGGSWFLSVSILGTLVAAMSSAAIAERLRPGLGRPTLWTVGVASPLFFDSGIVLAHAPAAGCAGAAALCAVLATRSTQGRGRTVALGVATVLLAASVVLLRTEGVMFGLGLAAALVVSAVRTRRRADGVLGLIVACSTVAVYVVERVWIRSVTGPAVTRAGTPLTNASPGWLRGRVDSVWNDWFDPGVTGHTSSGVYAVLIGAGVLVFGAVALRRSKDVRSFGLAVVAAAGLYGVRLLFSSPLELFGLFVAFPVLLAGLVLVGRAQVRNPLAQFLLVLSAVFAAGVVATNYAVGGSIQWGGRYFALAIPVLTPVALDALWSRIEAARAPRSQVRTAVVGLVVLSLVASLIGVRVLRFRHDTVASLSAAVSEMAQSAGPAGLGSDPDRPVVVAYNRLTPQMLYGDFDEVVWLGPDDRDDSGDRAAAALAREGVEQIVMINPSSMPDGTWDAWTEVDRASSSLGDVVVLRRCDDAC